VPAINSAICWKPLYQYKGQSAGNHLNRGEILRDHTLKIINYKLKFMISLKKKYYSTNIKINNKFNSYLAGLIEGDGCI